MSRAERVGVAIRQEIASLIERGLKDPRVGFTTITEVRLSRDLRHGKVFVSVLGTEAERESTLEGLRSAAGFIRGQLARRMRLRIIPELVFVWDPSIEQSMHISKLLKEVLGESSGDAGDKGQADGGSKSE